MPHPERPYFIDSDETPVSLLRRAARSATSLSEIHDKYARDPSIGPEAKAIQLNLVEKYKNVARMMGCAVALLEMK